MPKIFPGIGIQVPDVLLPVPDVDLSKWAVIACDQFTSQPEYWKNVDELVGNSPSTLNLILPEVYLDTPECQDRIKKIHRTMQSYLNQNVFNLQQGFIYVERTIGNRIRRGLIAALDLEQYDFKPDVQKLIRSTEGTIMERIPVRIQVRKGAALEVPHTLVLIDDPNKTVIEPLSQATDRMKPLYDVDLMMGSGHLSGWLVNQPDLELGIIQALQNLVKPNPFSSQHGLDADLDVMLFAIGDGNHSCAAAKVLWDELKTQPGIRMDHPARFALVEIENLQDPSQNFEPIHRMIFNLQVDIEAALQEYFKSDVKISSFAGEKAFEDMVQAVDRSLETGHTFGMVSEAGIKLITISNPAANLAIGTLQAFLDWLNQNKAFVRSDYVHGSDVVFELGTRPGNLGFFLPPIDKAELFRSVMLDGALPRKTFSMGAAKEKRFYMECRKITA